MKLSVIDTLAWLFVIAAITYFTAHVIVAVLR
jgi:hypothetical protein